MSKETGKCYRCGWCGQPTNEKGNLLSVNEANELNVDWDKAEQVDGDCCAEEQAGLRNQLGGE